MGKTLFLSATINKIEPWDHVLTDIDPSITVVPYSDDLDFSTIDTVIAWNPPEGIFPKLPNLKLIQSLGMGVDHLLKCSDLPTNVPIARLVDPDMMMQMSEYSLYGVMRAYRQMHRYQIEQRNNHAWKRHPRHFKSDFNIGILGLGELGLSVANTLVKNDFSVSSWSRSPKSEPNIESFHGDDQLDQFLENAHILICLLPLTHQTRDLIDYGFLKKLPKEAYIINPARGEHIVDEDLIRAINEGHISGALLDVFRTEPLPQDHPFWEMKEIDITPHIAAETNPHTSNDQIVENILRVRQGKSARNLIDLSKEY